MEIHIVSQSLIVLELAEEEEREHEALQELIGLTLVQSGFDVWPSMELEMYSFGAGQLIFAVPIRVFMPEFMANFKN
ncbi:MAG: hypothetical protein RR147_02895 [Oscillospiraceae bacterium]